MTFNRQEAEEYIAQLVEDFENDEICGSEVLDEFISYIYDTVIDE